MQRIPPQISIVGAGLSGLVLGRCLKHNGIPVVIYDRAREATPNNYGITLHRSTYTPLLSLLGMDESLFIKKVGVSACEDGSGNFAGGDAFRCHRGRFEGLLRQGLSVQWSHQLREIQLPSAQQGKSEFKAIFENGRQLNTTCLIGCDGPHSTVRQSMTSAMKLEVLPYAVFNGKRKIDLDEYKRTFHPLMKGSVKVSQTQGDAYLEISTSVISSSDVTVSYIYSRPANEVSDPLFKPNRSTSGARTIPNEFYAEVFGLGSLESPFKEVFNPEKMRKDRLLTWLMRCTNPDESELQRLSENGIVLVGDAAHALPILGGQGANVAIKDSIDLADFISENGVNNLEAFSRSRLQTWKDAVDDSKKSIAELHMSKPSHL